jgi:hypothetical protein
MRRDQHSFGSFIHAGHHSLICRCQYPAKSTLFPRFIANEAGIRSALEVTKAMIGLRDAEAFRAKSIELRGLILESLDKAIEARETYSAQLDRVRAMETEIASLREWNTEKQDYELKGIGEGAVAYMLKPDKRGSKPPHWLCPNCYSKGQKSFLNPTGAEIGGGWIYKCIGCGAQPSCNYASMWQD